MTTETSVATLSTKEFLEFAARPDMRTDPYPHYARWRSVAPVATVDMGIWVVTGYDAASEILRSSSFSNDERKSPLNDTSEEQRQRPFSRI